MPIPNIKVIESHKNPVIKTLANLKNRRDRDEEQRYLIEGSKEIRRAFDANKSLKQLYYSPKLLKDAGHILIEDLRAKLEFIELSKEAFEKLSMRQNPDGMIALAEMQEQNLFDLDLPSDALVLVIDGLEKPGNVGALLRTADAANVNAVFLTGKGTDIYNPNVIRSSLGSVFTRPVLSVETATLISFLQDRKIRLLATSPDASDTYWQTSFAGATAIVLGTEHEGLAETWFEQADATVNIPMHGMADSLNVATSGALLLYEALRQRNS